MIDAGRALEVGVQLTILVAAAYAGFRWFRGWLRREVGVPMRENSKLAQEVHHQVDPNGSQDRRTSRQLLEATAGDVETVGERIDALVSVTQENRQLANRAIEIATKSLGVAENTAARLDDHIGRGHS